MSDISIFVSYAHVDDDSTHGRIKSLIESITKSYHALTGDQVATFRDVEAIQLGDVWRERIRSGLTASSVMLAFVSPAYLRSVACREEFTEFRASLGQRLVIPLAYVDVTDIAAQFSHDHVWREISEIQYLEIAELRFEDRGSAAWMRKVEQIVRRIRDVQATFLALTQPKISSAGDSSTGVSISITPRQLGPGTSTDPDVAGISPTASDPLAGHTADRHRPGVLVIDGEYTDGRPEVVNGPRPQNLYPRLSRLEQAKDGSEKIIANLNSVVDQLDTLHKRVDGDVRPSVMRAVSFASKVSQARRQAGSITGDVDGVLQLSHQLLTAFELLDIEARSLLGAVYYGGGPTDAEKLLGVVRQLSRAGLQELVSLEAHNQVADGRSIRDYSPSMDRTLDRFQEAIMSLASVRALCKGWVDDLRAIDRGGA